MGDIVLDDASRFPLSLLRENDESEKLAVKASCGFEHDLIKIFLLGRSIHLRGLL